MHFYPRSPCGERQYLVRGQRPSWGISIHALLAESDCIMTTTICIASRFLSTLSLRRATGFVVGNWRLVIFLSTLSLRRATAIDVFLAVWAVISIHALLAESDMIHPLLCNVKPNFYPRSPCGERHDATLHCLRVMRISIHALLAESDPKRYPVILGRVISIHALLAESDFGRAFWPGLSL